jgi:hypothetical protein
MLARSPLPLLAALVALCVAAPAAGAQVLGDGSCPVPSAATCTGLDKLGERVSAECRRSGLASDADCWSRVGRRVVREEIDRYEASWTHRTLAFQSRLGDRVPFADAPWIGTHNSFNDVGESPTVSHTDSNQQLGLADQLRLDVRSLELDVHWLPSARAGGMAPVVCHGQGAAGCSTERLLSERLAEVVGWLDAHPREVLLLYLEDQIDDPAGYAAAAGVVTQALGSRLYRPRGDGCRDLPLTLTRSAVRAAGARVVVVGDCGSGAWQGVSHAWPAAVRFESRPKGFSCARSIPADAQPRIVRFFEDSTFVAPAGERTGVSSTDDGLTPATVREMIACGVDLFGFDQLLPGDGRLDALVWSWAPGRPEAGRGRCTAQRADGRWDRRPCARRLRPACEAGDGRFAVLGGRVSRSRAARRCAARRMRLALPRTARRNAALRAVAGRRIVWLAHRAR